VRRAGLLLAAGQSTRFGAENKLLAPLDGTPLVTHAARAMESAGFDRLLAVVSDQTVGELLSGFEICMLGHGPSEQSRSLSAGIEALGDVERVTIALGDMPRVTAAILRDVTNLCPTGGAAACSDGQRRMPPAAFDAACFPRLMALSGDKGAAPLLREIPEDQILTPDPGCLVDVDTPEALARLSS
jgi:molybdenum cofactor cytidylyltransferase